MKNLICTASVVLFLILTLSTHPTQAATIHIPADQSTIQAGIDAAVDGDIVLVAPDTYVENIDFLGKAIALQSEGGAEATVIDGNATDTVVFFRNGETGASIIEGFTITNGLGIYDEDVSKRNGYNVHRGGGVTCFDASPQIRNCSIIGNTALGYGIWTGGGGIACRGLFEDPSPIIVNCIISDNIKTTYVSATEQFYGGGIGTTASSPIIANCTITGNSFSSPSSDRVPHFSCGGGFSSYWGTPKILNCSITMNTAQRGAGIYVGPASKAIIQNCTITLNNGDGLYFAPQALPTVTNNTIHGRVCAESTSQNITNSIIWGDPNPICCDLLTITYSDVQGGYPGIGNIDSDPLFIGGEDYHVTEGSPCIDAGNPDPSFNDECFPPSMGKARNDIGAYGGPDACGWTCWDADGDGYDAEFCGGTDCGDYSSLIYPGAVELCDALDNDCDGIVPDDEVDDDEDGWLQCKECDDTDPEINPGLFETLGTGNCEDGKDNDCDGLVDTDPECEDILVPSIHHPTIQSAIDAAGIVGDRVIVSPGSYTEDIDFLGKAIKLKSQDGTDTTMIDGEVSISGGTTDNAILEGFMITSGSNGISCRESSPVIKDCRIWSCNQSGIECKSASPKIMNCFVNMNGEKGITCKDSSPIITNCFIYGNRATIIGGGIYCNGSSYPIITNCTITGNDAWDFHLTPGAGGGIAVRGEAIATITNSIIWGNRADVAPDIYATENNVVITFSDVFGCWPGFGNICQDPLFEFDGYHLKPQSPCIDAGRPVKLFTDIDGQRRPFGDGWDMGADEYSTTEPCSVIASSGNQFLAFYLIPALALIFFGRRFLRR